MKRLISLALVVALVVCLMAVPASAELVAELPTDNISSPAAIDLGKADRIYNDDGTVTVTYDILDPYMKFYGVVETFDDAGEHEDYLYDELYSGTKLIFSQSVGTTESAIFSSLLSAYNYDSSNRYSTSTLRAGGTVYSVSLALNYGDNVLYPTSLPDGFDAVTFEGKTYPVEIGTAISSLNSSSVKCYIGNPALAYTTSMVSSYYLKDENGNKLTDNGLPFYVSWYPSSSSYGVEISSSVSSFVSPSGDPVITFGTLESEITYSSDYDDIDLRLWPMGYHNTNMPMLDISDIKAGSGFDLTFDYSWDASGDGNLQDMFAFFYFVDAAGQSVSSAFLRLGVSDENVSGSQSITVPDGAKYVYVKMIGDGDEANPTSYWNFEMTSFSVSAVLTAAENSDLAQKEQNSQIIDELGGKLDDVNQNLDDIEGAIDEGLGDVSDKLDDVNGNLDDVENAVGDVADKVEESNTWLENISEGITSLPQKIGEMITGLFVPDADGMAEQQDKWNQLLVDHFGAVYESVEIMDEVAAAFSIQDVQEQIEFPSVVVPLSGVDFELGGWMVDVVPDGFEFLIEILKKIIDILCTFAFVTAMRNRLEKILGGAA